MRKYAANLGLLWQDLPFLERIEAAARSGFRAVEFHFPYSVPAEQVRKVTQQCGVRVLGINSPPGNLQKGELGIACIPGREAEFAAGIQQALDYCEAAEASALHVMAGKVVGHGMQECLPTFRNNLSRAAEAASKRNVKILLEPLNRFQYPAYLYHEIDEAAAIIRWIDHPNLRIQFDTYHVGVQGANVSEVMERNWADIGHIQFAAVPDRGEPDRGDVDVGSVLQRAEALGYDGWFAAEYAPRGGTDSGLSWMQEPAFA